MHRVKAAAQRPCNTRRVLPSISASYRACSQQFIEFARIILRSEFRSASKDAIAELPR
jgi:hypothetical protein